MMATYKPRTWLAAGVLLGMLLACDMHPSHAQSPVQSSHNARLWAQLSAAQQQQVREQWQAWQQLPPEQRRRYTDGWRAWQHLTPAERQQMQAAAEQRQTLPLSERNALREQFDALDTNEQRGWLLGPDLGRDWPRLQPLLAQVPPAQREPLLQVLRQMTRSQRESLGILAQRVPPQERAALREELLRTPAQQRDQWLRAKLGG